MNPTSDTPEKENHQNEGAAPLQVDDPAPDFRQPREISWRTTLIAPPSRVALLRREIGPEKANEYLAELALGLGYGYVCISPEIFEVVPPDGSGAASRLVPTEMRAEEGLFVAYLVVSNNRPLMLPTGQPAVFVSPADARLAAARNGGVAMRVDEFQRRMAEQSERRVITPDAPSKAGELVIPSSVQG